MPLRIPLSHFGTRATIFVSDNLVLQPVSCLASAMTRILQFRLWLVLPLVIIAQAGALAATKPHIITFGKWTTVQGSLEPSVATRTVDDKPLSIKVRPLLVDARVKEFTLGPAHDVTDRLFVVRRAFRVNDSLPQEPASPPHWQWQRGGWLLVDRATGHISPLNLPEFDAVYSAVSWYRDYAAYCGITDDNKEIHAVVFQINRRKPVVKWLIGETKFTAATQQWQIPDSACGLPDWQRSPARVTFEPNPSLKRTYVIRGRSVDLLTDEEDNEEASK